MKQVYYKLCRHGNGNGGRTWTLYQDFKYDNSIESVEIMSGDAARKTASNLRKRGFQVKEEYSVKRPFDPASGIFYIE